jgi:hypothetical protein
MPIGEAVAVTVLALGMITSQRLRFNPLWSCVGWGVLGGLALALVLRGLRWVIIAGPITGSFTLGALLLGSLAWAEVLGLPRDAARLLGIGLMSRALVFSNHLGDLMKRFGDAISRAQEGPDRRASAMATAEVQLRRMEALRPPDPAWGQIRDKLVSRRRAVWLAAAGFSALLNCVARIGAGLLPLDVTDPQLWMTLGSMAVASGALVAAAVLVVRR